MIDLKETLKQDITSYVIGVPNFVIDKAIVDACKKFLNESLVWREKQTLSAYTREVLVFPNDPVATSIADVTEVRDQNRNAIAHNWYASKIFFNRPPNKDVFVEFALTNNRAKNRAEVPDWIYNQYSFAIVHCAINLIKSQQSKPWFDPDGASFHFNEYKQNLGEALIDVSPDRVAMNPFA